MLLLEVIFSKTVLKTLKRLSLFLTAAIIQVNISRRIFFYTKETPYYEKQLSKMCRRCKAETGSLNKD